jgi:uncharacterized protein (TIGR02646 family)
MIFVRRPNVPSLLTNAPLYKHWTDRIKNLLQTPQGIRNTVFSYDSPRRIEGFMDVLGEVFFHKCAYCEVKLGKERIDTLAFFRPSKDARQNDKGPHSPEHYWWLSWEWSNFYLACPPCIQAKNRQFPINKNRAEPGTYGDALRNEEPLLLDPCFDAPFQHLLFEEDGRIAPRHKSERGVATIETLKLDREALVSARRGRAQEAKSLFLECVRRTANNENKVDDHIAVALIEELKSWCREDQPFAAMLRQLLNHWIHTEMPAVMLNDPHWQNLLSELVSFQHENTHCGSVILDDLEASKTDRSFISSIKQELLIDFAIVTAKEVERLAVCRAFHLTERDRVPKESRQYWRGRISLENDEFYEIVVTQIPNMANVDAALAANDMIHHWKPGALLMVGIAAAATKEQALGDAVAGGEVYYDERGKVTPTGIKPEPTMYKADATLWNRITTLPAWKKRIHVSRPDRLKSRPQIHYGVIFSSERVIADERMRDELLTKHRKIVAIEMEGYGVSAAAWQSFHQVRHLVIRAICDLADSSKNDTWHRYAAAVAAGFAKHFLLDRPLEPRNTYS